MSNSDTVAKMPAATILAILPLMTQAILLLPAGSNANAYAQLGHGGEDAHGTQSGKITINKAENIEFTAGSVDDDAYAQLGHGGRAGPANKGRHVSTLSGDITIGQADDVSFTGGSERFNYAQLGHGGAELSGDFSGNISLNDVGNVSLSGGSGNNTYAQIGHGSGQSNYNHEFDDVAYGTRQGDITINSRGSISTLSGFYDDAVDDAIDHNTLAIIGHQSGGVSESEAGNPISDSNVSITATGWNVDNNNSVFDETISAMLAAAMNGGDVNINLTGSNLQLGSALNYSSNNTLLLRSENGDVILNGGSGVNNGGNGDFVLVAGQNFQNNSGSAAPLNTGGRWLVYSTNPDDNNNNVAEGDFEQYATGFDPDNPVPSGTGSGYFYESQEPEPPVEPEPQWRRRHQLKMHLRTTQLIWSTMT